GTGVGRRGSQVSRGALRNGGRQGAHSGSDQEALGGAGNDRVSAPGTLRAGCGAGGRVSEARYHAGADWGATGIFAGRDFGSRREVNAYFRGWASSPVRYHSLRCQSVPATPAPALPLPETRRFGPSLPIRG